MGRKGSWISAVKKALSPQSKDKKEKETHRSKSISLGKHGSTKPASSPAEIALPAPATSPTEEVKFTEAESKQNKDACSIALASVAAEEAATQAAAEVVQQTNVAHYSGKTEEEVAAIKIQTAFRGYLARMALRALRGLVRLKSLTQGKFIKRQATTTLHCMQTLVRVQSQVRARRIRMSEENQTLQRQLQQKREIELEKSGTSVSSVANFQVEENWNHSAQSKEQMEAKLQSKQEAAARRERALAYAYSRQKTLKNSSKPVNAADPTFMDPINPIWGWSWLDRWMEARPWENRELNNDNTSVKRVAARAISVGEFNKAHSHDGSLKNSKPPPTAQKLNHHYHHHLPSQKSPLTPPSKAPPPPMAIKTRPTPPKSNGHGGGNNEHPRSKLGSQTRHFRRHSVAVSSSRDNKSVEENAPATIPSPTTGTTKSMKAPTNSAKVIKSSLRNGTLEKGSVRTVKKQHSFPSSVAETRRHSGPPKMVSSAGV